MLTAVTCLSNAGVLVLRVGTVMGASECSCAQRPPLALEELNNS